MSNFVRPSSHQLDPPGVSFPEPDHIGELYEEDDIVYSWTGDRWIVSGRGVAAGGGVSQDYVDDQINEIKRDYLTTSQANKTYLRDGFTNNQLCINRTGGGSIDSMKVTAISGGASIWRLDCKAGKDGPSIYKVEGDGSHQFVGKVNLSRVADEKQGFKIQGRRTDGTVGDLFYVYHNGGSVADAVNYTGKITSPNNIVNKEYVDGHVSRKIEVLEARIRALEADTKRVRARNPDGTYRGDDPSTPDVNEAWEES